MAQESWYLVSFFPCRTLTAVALIPAPLVIVARKMSTGRDAEGMTDHRASRGPCR